jgi:chloramphenicol 3-O phosphotransferase
VRRRENEGYEEAAMMSKGTVILLNGTSCSGKTTIARAIQEQMPQPYLHVGLDHFEAMQPVRDGKRIHIFYGQRGLNGNDPKSWGPDLIHVMHQCIAEFALVGVNVVAEHIFLEQAWLEDAVERLGDHDVLFVGVLCPLKELEIREREREGSDPSSGQAARQLRQLGPLATPDWYDLALDTSSLSPVDCARRIRDHLETAAPKTAFYQLKSSPILRRPDVTAPKEQA